MRGLLVDALWPLQVSVVCSTRVFDDVGVVAGRGVGRVAGRGWCRWCGTSACSSVFGGVDMLGGRRLGRQGRLLLDGSCVFEGVGGVAGRRLVVGVACWLTTFACSRV